MAIQERTITAAPPAATATAEAPAAGKSRFSGTFAALRHRPRVETSVRHHVACTQ